MTPSDCELVHRAMRNVRNLTSSHRARWVLVKDVFAVGSTTAALLCKRFGLDPDESIPPIEW